MRHFKDYSEYNNLGEFIYGSGFEIKLTPKGRELLSEMEATLATSRPRIVKTSAIGFTAPC